MKMSNKEASSEELVFDREYTVEDYAQAHRHVLYLPDADAMILYVAWCTNKELRMDTMCGSFWTLDTTPIINIMHYHYHIESYNTLINYAQTHPTENEYLKEV
jgi:hypothetical protein